MKSHHAVALIALALTVGAVGFAAIFGEEIVAWCRRRQDAVAGWRLDRTMRKETR